MNPADMAKWLHMIIMAQLQHGPDVSQLTGARIVYAGCGLQITYPDGRQQTISISEISSPRPPKYSYGR